MKIEQLHPYCSIHIYEIDSLIADKIRKIKGVLEVQYQSVGHYTIELEDDTQSEQIKQQIRRIK